METEIRMIFLYMGFILNLISFIILINVPNTNFLGLSGIFIGIGLMIFAILCKGEK